MLQVLFSAIRVSFSAQHLFPLLFHPRMASQLKGERETDRNPFGLALFTSEAESAHPKEARCTIRLSESCIAFARRLLYAPYVRALPFGQSFSLGLACLVCLVCHVSTPSVDVQFGDPTKMKAVDCQCDR